MHYLIKTLVALSLALGGVALMSVAAPSVAMADSSQRIAAKTKQAMEAYDMMEFEAAKKQLIEAIAIGKDDRSSDSVMASAYLNLGIVYFSGLGDEAKAGEAFASALKSDSRVALDVAYATPQMSALLEKLRKSGSAPESEACKVFGLRHELVEEAVVGSATKIRVQVGPRLKASEVLLFYRSEGQQGFERTRLSPAGACEFVGFIPGGAVRGSSVHYYVSAQNRRGKEVGHKGTSASPNIIEVAAASTGPDVTDADDPLDTRETEPRNSIEEDRRRHRVFVSIAAGSGIGYVQGPTEKTRGDVNCCTAPAYFHLMPEIGYYVSDQLSISVAGRMGFTIGANVEGHATFAPAGFLKFRYTLNESGEGLMFSALLGAGMIRNVVSIRDSAPGMDVDTTVMGPVLFGGGFGYAKSLGGPLRLVAELNLIGAAVAGFSEVGSCPGDGCVQPKSGAEADGSLALLFAF